MKVDVENKPQCFFGIPLFIRFFEAMAMLLYTFLLAFGVLSSRSRAQTDENLMKSLVQLYSTTAVTDRYFSANGKTMFEQVSMLDSMALAKVGRLQEAREQLTFLAIQSLLYDLPPEYRAAGDLLKLMHSERSFFHRTVAEGQNYLQSVSTDVKAKLAAFDSSQKTDQDKERIQGEIQDAVKGNRLKLDLISSYCQC